MGTLSPLSFENIQARVRTAWQSAAAPIRGRVVEAAPLHPHTWFRVGGNAAVLFRPKDVQDLATALHALPQDIPVLCLGVGSNTLIRDGGFAGVVVRLGGGFAKINVDETTQVLTVGAGALDSTVAETACIHGIGGLEFLSGIPGTIGGNIRMNAGAYGTEMKDIFLECTAVDRAGTVHTLHTDDMGFGYRHCDIPTDWLFVSAKLQGQLRAQKDIQHHMQQIQSARGTSQPIRARTGGSTFANPPGKRAWELIDAAGCRGLRLGGAQVSEQHCNFLINMGDASAHDLETLGNTVKQRVYDTSGITLRWEIRRVGEHVTPQAQSTATLTSTYEGDDHG
jgi:UDP-N-acetylmuramate dehydrogenase